ncbi:MAG TPA: 3D domain-containing protein [Candidatus Eremiobacteraceae bacterium]|nr:3D domain-containing protein [Candidatus Eremiobacteraceae bacterium]
MTLISQIRDLFATWNKQPHARRAAYRISILIVTALLAVATKSPQAFAQPASALAERASAAMSSAGSMVIGAADKRTQPNSVTGVSDAQSFRNQVASDGFSVSTTIAPMQISTEYQTHRVFTKVRPIIRVVADLAPGARKIVRHGAPAVTLVTERVTKWDGIVVDGQVVGKRLVQHARPAEIVVGPPRNITEALALTKFRKLVGVFAMVATAYTAGSAQGWPTGRTATGAVARYGVVAVDPRVIPLGAHLFIPGYGTAIAADTGGAIVGNRVDLCMDSLQAALNFGRQAVKVYVISQ